MSLLETLSTWLEAPYTAFYECSDCGSRFKDSDSACPECGGELDIDQPPEHTIDHWWLM